MMQPTKRKNPTNNFAKELKDRKYYRPPTEPQKPVIKEDDYAQEEW